MKYIDSFNSSGASTTVISSTSTSTSTWINTYSSLDYGNWYAELEEKSVPAKPYVSFAEALPSVKIPLTTAPKLEESPVAAKPVEVTAAQLALYNSLKAGDVIRIVPHAETGHGFTLYQVTESKETGRVKGSDKPAHLCKLIFAHCGITGPTASLSIDSVSRNYITLEVSLSVSNDVRAFPEEYRKSLLDKKFQEMVGSSKAPESLEDFRRAVSSKLVLKSNQIRKNKPPIPVKPSQGKKRRFRRIKLSMFRKKFPLGVAIIPRPVPHPSRGAVGVFDENRPYLVGVRTNYLKAKADYALNTNYLIHVEGDFPEMFHRLTPDYPEATINSLWSNKGLFTQVRFVLASGECPVFDHPSWARFNYHTRVRHDEPPEPNMQFLYIRNDVNLTNYGKNP